LPICVADWPKWGPPARAQGGHAPPASRPASLPDIAVGNGLHERGRNLLGAARLIGEQSHNPVNRRVRKSTEGQAAMKEKTLEDLFHDTLKDIYYAERKILKALPKMAKAASSPELKAAFEKHKDETEGQIERLQQVFELMGKRAQGKTCDAIEGIIAEGEEIIESFKGTPAIDAGLISSAQAVEHYEITRYGTLKRWAEVLDLEDAAKLLDETLEEESKTDEALTELADASANEMATAA
jgi:ferritin-like metal-binding protein YciE